MGSFHIPVYFYFFLIIFYSLKYFVMNSAGAKRSGLFIYLRRTLLSFSGAHSHYYCHPPREPPQDQGCTGCWSSSLEDALMFREPQDMLPNAACCLWGLAALIVWPGGDSAVSCPVWEALCCKTMTAKGSGCSVY